MNDRCDVLVVGAGPAGSALAIQLARAGFDVVLTDRKTFPRRKPCGEFLSPQCRPYLRELDLDADVIDAGAALVRGMHLHGHGRHAHGNFRALPDRLHGLRGYGIRREVFDLMLLEAARRRPEVRVLEQHRCTDLVRVDDRVAGAVLVGPDRNPKTIRATWVVGADGVRSIVARQLGVQRRIGWLDRMALVSRFEGVEPEPEAEVHFVPGGYFAATSVDARLFHLNLVVDRSALEKRTGDWDEFVADRLRHAPLLREKLLGRRRIEAWTGTGPLAYRTTRQAVPGAALVGDAAGYVDPLTGEGIYFALFTARALAESLVTARADLRRETVALADYERQRRREVGPRLLLAAVLQHGLRHDWVVRTFLAALASRSRLCDLLVTLTGDSVHPRELLQPSFWRAWRAAEATS